MFDDIFDVFHLVVVEGGDFTGGWGEDFGSPRVAWSPAHGHFVVHIDMAQDHVELSLEAFHCTGHSEWAKDHTFSGTIGSGRLTDGVRVLTFSGAYYVTLEHLEEESDWVHVEQLEWQTLRINHNKCPRELASTPAEPQELALMPAEAALIGPGSADEQALALVPLQADSDDATRHTPDDEQEPATAEPFSGFVLQAQPDSDDTTRHTPDDEQEPATAEPFSGFVVVDF